MPGDREETLSSASESPENYIVRGSIERVFGYNIIGWIESGDAKSNYPISIYIDGMHQVSGVLDVIRPDLTPHHIVGRGFDVSLPKELFDGSYHLVEVKPETATNTIKSLLYFPDFNSDRTGAPPKKNKGEIGPCNFLGSITEIRDFSIRGWLIDIYRTNAPVEVALFVDGQFITKRRSADSPEYLKNTPFRDSGFFLHIPQEFFDGSTHLIELQEYNTNQTWVDGCVSCHLERDGTGATIEISQTSLGNRIADVVSSVGTRGNLNRICSTEVTGWAFDPENPDLPINLVLYVDDEPIAHFATSHPLNHLVPGREIPAGFKCELPSDIRRSAARKVSLYRQDSSETVEGCVQYTTFTDLIIPRGKESWRRPETAKEILSDFPFPYAGRIDAQVGEVISGWVVDLRDNDTQIWLRVSIDGVPIGFACSNQYRHDANWVFKSRTNGFALPVPAEYRTGTRRRIDCSIVSWSDPESADFAARYEAYFSKTPEAALVEGHLTRQVSGGGRTSHGYAIPIYGAFRSSDEDFFDENAYLNHYPDVRAAIDGGIFETGIIHWMTAGKTEEALGLRDGAWRVVAKNICDLRSAFSLRTKEVVELSRIGDWARVLLEQYETASSVDASLSSVESGLTKQTEQFLRAILAWRDASPLINLQMNKELIREAAIYETLEYKPLISIIMPVYNVDAVWLRAAIESVRAQTYPHWELCISDDCSPSSHIKETLLYYKKIDPRIKLHFMPKNSGISAATNSAIAISEGEFLAFLDHDDEYHYTALLEVAKVLNEDRNIDYIYSDEAKIDESGNVFGEFYKPDWSPELILMYMYTCHLSVYRSSVVCALGGLRSEFDGAQDYDLALRVVGRTEKIKHIPKVLYLWRTLETSTARVQVDAKDYAVNRARRAVHEHFERAGVQAEIVSGRGRGMHKPNIAIRGKPKVSIVIPTAGLNASVRGESLFLLGNLLTSIYYKSSYREFEVVVVDNGDLGSEKEKFIENFGIRRISYLNSTFNLAEKINFGVDHAGGEFIMLMNDDMEIISKDWIEGMLQYAQLPGVGTVGPKLLFENGRVQHAGITILNGMPGHAYYGSLTGEQGHGGILLGARNVIGVTGACMLTPAKVYRKFDGYDEVFPLNFNDVDYSLRLLSAGYRHVYTPFVEIFHFESLSRGDTAGRVLDGELATYRERWNERRFVDPYYNPNLPLNYPYGFVTPVLETDE